MGIGLEPRFPVPSESLDDASGTSPTTQSSSRVARNDTERTLGEVPRSRRSSRTGAASARTIVSTRSRSSPRPSPNAVGRVSNTTPSRARARRFAPGANRATEAHAVSAPSSDATRTRASRISSVAPGPTNTNGPRSSSDSRTTMDRPPPSRTYDAPATASARTRRVEPSSRSASRRNVSPGRTRTSAGRTSSGASPPPPASVGTNTRPTSRRNVGSASTRRRWSVTSTRAPPTAGPVTISAASKGSRRPRLSFPESSTAPPRATVLGARSSRKSSNANAATATATAEVPPSKDATSTANSRTTSIARGSARPSPRYRPNSTAGTRAEKSVVAIVGPSGDTLGFHPRRREGRRNAGEDRGEGEDCFASSSAAAFSSRSSTAASGVSGSSRTLAFDATRRVGSIHAGLTTSGMVAGRSARFSETHPESNLKSADETSS